MFNIKYPVEISAYWNIIIPGLSDETLRENASNAIQEGLKKYSCYRVLFFVTERNGRVLMQDTTTMKLILEASPDIGMNYGIIVNMLSKGTVLQS